MSNGSKLLLLLVASLALRCAVAASVPLLGGEAYYWLWGQYLSAGYFDHPPMVGLMSRLFLGDIQGSALAARSGALVLGVLTLAALYGFVCEMFGDSRLALRAATLCAITPILIVIGMAILPDNSLVLFTVLAWWLFWRAMEKETDLITWLAVGAACGVALLSKFHAWVLLPPLWLFLLLSPQRRPLLKTPGPWIAAAMALVVLSPNLFWNAQRGWLNYGFQWHRSAIPRSSFDLTNLGIFLIGALLSLSPLLCVAIVGAIGHTFKRWRDDDRLLFLLCAGLPLPLFLGLLSFLVKISFHWPSCGYPALIVLALVVMERGGIFGRRFHRGVWATAIAMTVILYLSAPVLSALRPVPPDGEEGNAFVSLNRLQTKRIGWQALGQRVASLRDAMQATHPTIIMAKSWHLTSLLAFYTERPTECFAFREKGAHHYELWREERGGLEGVNALVVIEKPKPNRQHSRLKKKYDKFLADLRPLFRKVRPAPSIIFYADGSVEERFDVEIPRPRVREFMVFRCYGFKGKLEAEDAATER